MGQLSLRKEPFQESTDIRKIEDNQLYLSSYYDSTRYVMQQAAQKQQTKQIEL